MGVSRGQVQDIETTRWRAVERYLLYLMAASLPLQGVALLPGTQITVTKAAGALLIAAVLLRVLWTRRVHWGSPAVFIAVTLFAAACALSLVHSVDRAITLSALRTFFLYALTLFAVAQAADSEKAQRHIPALYIAAAGISGALAVLALAGVVTPTVDRVVTSSNVHRICVGVHDSNDQALLFLFALCFALFDRTWTRDGRHAALTAAATLGILAGLVLTMSRSGWALAALLFLVRAATARHRVRYAGALLAGGLVALALVAAVKPDVLASAHRRVVELFEQGDRSVASRVTHLSLAVDRAREGGAFGSGLGTAMDLRQPFNDPLGQPITTIVHNVPLLIWMETGWVGLLSFGWLWSSVIAALFVAFRGQKEAAQRDRIAAYAALAATYGAMSLAMPFLYRSAFPIGLGCALGAMTAKAEVTDPTSE